MEELSELQLQAMSQFENTSIPPQGGNATENNKLKRPPNAFLLYCIENRAKIREQNPDASNIEASKILADLWKAMSEESRLPYKNKAKIEQQKFKTNNPEYSYERAKKKRAYRKSNNLPMKPMQINIPDLKILVNLPLDQLKQTLLQLQEQFYGSCQEIQQILQDYEIFQRPTENNFSNQVFQQCQ
ncbi:HMG box family protein [Histomonas meleagridis]|uniref:HMG box family protein n=1 Tax=Histomonas meleagridis TaxID=135588 RepID=UPI00355AB904|nr:HMG box family protein [Histomonas meleagridis]KAH0799901.1 HMG box family protein [Histomonas meleagridis]